MQKVFIALNTKWGYRVTDTRDFRVRRMHVLHENSFTISAWSSVMIEDQMQWSSHFLNDSQDRKQKHSIDSIDVSVSMLDQLNC